MDTILQYIMKIDDMLRWRRNKKIDILLHLISFVCGDTSSTIFEFHPIVTLSTCVQVQERVDQIP